MTPEQVELARRVTACRGWRWMPGMAWFDEKHLQYRVQSEAHAVVIHEDRLPDLADPATLGCLLALVRQAWRCPTIYVRQSGVRRVSDGVLAWEVCDLWLDAQACRALGVEREGSVGCWGHANEAEALVAALEGAP